MRWRRAGTARTEERPESFSPGVPSHLTGGRSVRRWHAVRLTRTAGKAPVGVCTPVGAGDGGDDVGANTAVAVGRRTAARFHGRKLACTCHHDGGKYEYHTHLQSSGHLLTSFPDEEGYAASGSLGLAPRDRLTARAPEATALRLLIAWRTVVRNAVQARVHDGRGDCQREGPQGNDDQPSTLLSSAETTDCMPRDYSSGRVGTMTFPKRKLYPADRQLAVPAMGFRSRRDDDGAVPLPGELHVAQHWRHTSWIFSPRRFGGKERRSLDDHPSP